MQAVTAPSADTRYIGGERLNFSHGGKKFRCNFIEPGFVNYSDTPGLGMELLRKEAIDASLATVQRVPLTIGHVPTNAPVPSDRIHGYVEIAGYDERTNWYWCEGPVDTDEARDLIRKGWKTSIGFKVAEVKPGGMDHNIAFTQELSRVNFHHLAIVDNPRYEGANIRLNALGHKGDTAMFKWIKKVIRQKEGGATETVDETGELPADATIEIDGQPVRLNDLKEQHLKAEKAKAEADAARLAGDAEIEVEPGKRVKVSVLADSYRANATAEAARTKAAKAEADRLEEERKNAGAQSFRVLAAAPAAAAQAAQPTAPVGNSGTLEERMRLGSERYGAQGKN